MGSFYSPVWGSFMSFHLESVPSPYSSMGLVLGLEVGAVRVEESTLLHPRVGEEEAGVGT